MKKALAYALSLALLLSLSACHKPQQPVNSQPDPAATSSQADVTTPEPPKAPVPEQLSDTVPAAPAENEDPQDQAEPATQEPAAQEPVSEPVQPETPPVTAENPPAETTPTKPAQEQQPPKQELTEQEEADQMLQEMMKQGQKKTEDQKQSPPSGGGGITIQDILAEDPDAWIDENGSIHSSYGDNAAHIRVG